MGLHLEGKVVGIKQNKTPKGTDFRSYQILNVTTKGTAILMNVDDFDLTRKVEMEKMINIPVYASPYVAKNGKAYIQYKAVSQDNAMPMNQGQARGVKV